MLSAPARGLALQLVEHEAELMLWNRKRAAGASHGLGGLEVGGMAAAVLGAGVIGDSVHGDGAARVLPKLPPVVPMEAKLGECRGDLGGLLVGERDPDPFADNLGQFVEAGSLGAEQGQQVRRAQGAVGLPFGEIHRGAGAIGLNNRCAGLDREPFNV